MSGSSHEACPKLRWKGMFVDVPEEPTVPNQSSGMFWCSRTMNGLGPDGRPADRARCGPGRACFVATHDALA